MPLGKWFRGPLYAAARELLCSENSRICDFMRRDMITRLIEENSLGLADNGKRIWALLNLEQWLRQLNEQDY